MRTRVPDEATCAICGRHFDPSETRGWCPNPSCGEWQHPAFPVDQTDSDDEPADEPTASTGPSTPTKDCPNCGNTVRADANFCKHCAAQLSGDSDGDSAETNDTAVECPDCGADLSEIPADRLSQCPICMFDLGPLMHGDDAAGTETSTGAGTNTGTESATSSDTDRGFGTGTETGTGTGADPDTGSGVGNDAGSGVGNGTGSGAGSGVGSDAGSGVGSDAGSGVGNDTGTGAGSGVGSDAGSGFGSDAGTGGAAGNTKAGGTAGEARSTALTNVDSIASGYVQRLSEVGVNTVGDLQRANPDTVSEKTGISARRIRGWAEETSGDSDGGGDSTSGPGSGAGVAGLDGQTTKIQRSADDLVLEVMGEEITVTDGETVGREVRSAMVRAGAPKEEAVYVHRKHIRIEVDGDGFWLTRLGENSLALNGQTVEKGATVPVEDGDEIVFSNVVTATVSVR